MELEILYTEIWNNLLCETFETLFKKKLKHEDEDLFYLQNLVFHQGSFQKIFFQYYLNGFQGHIYYYIFSLSFFGRIPASKLICKHSKV